MQKKKGAVIIEIDEEMYKRYMEEIRRLSELSDEEIRKLIPGATTFHRHKEKEEPQPVV